MLAPLKIWTKRAWDLANGKLKSWEWPEIYLEDDPEPIRRLHKAGKPIGFDIETNGINIDSAIMCMGFANEDFAVSIQWPPENESTRAAAVEILEDPSIQKAMHNGQHDVLVCRSHGIAIHGFDFDTLLAHATVGSQLPHDLGLVAALEYHAPRWKTEFKVTSDAKGLEAFTKRDPLELRLYNAKDAYMTTLLRRPLLARLARTHCGWELYSESFSLADLAMRMRLHGISMDPAARSHLREVVLDKLDEYKMGFYDTVGYGGWKFGMSGQHPSLVGLFYDAYGLTPTRWSKETGNPALTADALQDIIAEAEPEPSRAARALLAYRRWYKLLSTYIDGISTDSANVIHPTWKVYGTVTGRWSSQGPNMQNIPKARYKEGKDGKKVEVTPSLRGLFIPPTKRWIMEADYSQLELRIMAVLSGCRYLLDIYRSGGDVHNETARAVFGEDFTKKERDLAKRIEYGFNYNLSEDVTTVWRSLVVEYPKLTVKQVKLFRKKWFDLCPEIYKWQHEQVKQVRSCGYVEEPLSGRREHFHLYLDGKVDPNKVLNFPIQGFAGTLMNRAILELDGALDRSHSEILLQVHDAIVLETDDPQRAGESLTKAMEQKVTLSGQEIAFPIDLQLGTNWGNMEEIDAMRQK